ncbi:FAD/NAD(P)-binding protein [Pararhizobium gei]|uniref:FAD/NAD(P)-binding protein n=1 Tax=Pararhizobium gei TaxID=1395951 RepID=UPI0023DA0884|nr:FAD/NAD(P)-binding protein [Rhizobium gei]
MTSIAIIGSGPTGIYTLKGLMESETPLSVTVYEANADPGKGTPYHPRANDRAMLANIASIELPPVCESLTHWLRRKSPAELAMLGVPVETIGEREFYPRVVLGAYFEAQLNALLAKAVARGHTVDIKASHRVLDIQLRESDINVEVKGEDGATDSKAFDHVVMATGHDWPEKTETKPGFFISPWPAKNLDTIGDVSVGVLGTSLSGIDAVVSVATAHGSFLLDDSGTMQYHSASGPDFHLTMMSRKGLLPEADFYCPIPYEPLSIFTEAAVDRLVDTVPDRLLDEIFELFRAQLFASDPAYSERIGLGMLTVETVADAYFSERESYDPFTWAALNLGEARTNKATRTTVAWRYSILCMHETVLRAVPHFNEEDLKRFHKYFKTLFVDDYATVPHQSIERLLALHRAGRLSVLKLGPDYRLDNDSAEQGAVIEICDDRHAFTAFIDATGQHAVSAWDVPFPSLIAQGVVREARTVKASTAFAATDDTATVATGGIDLDSQFRPKFEKPLSHSLYCVSIPFLLHKLPFVQGITSAEELGSRVAKSILDDVGCREFGLKAVRHYS